MKKIIKYVLLDLLRNRIIIAYTLFLAVISLSVFNLEDNPSKGILSLLNLVLIIVPLVSIIFSTIYVYNAAEFIELLVSQPLRRVNIWLSIFTGLASSVCMAFLVGCGIPVLIYAPGDTGLMMTAMGLLLTIVFVAIALLASALTRDKAKGIGVAILLWFYFTLIFDGIVLFLLFQFMDYPMEKPMVVFSCLNPVDLARILILLKLDMSALMGATSAVFRSFFGNQLGIVITIGVMLAWAVTPLWWSVRKFNRKDL
ncbi:nitrous oxide reductase [Niastella koreensis]|uniref:Nitrous-oxide metabolic protein NosY n=2 Tax=Niastella koreensis TaxID=354356 RepID=G8TDR9_NIAKG|nr:ABC transporter permease subunit [Niastella koreensis]AEW01519.1 nitrous-oxide metabolic protein NosY [Niastella koreensis GR20-10]OQP48241.1 nitrous oxide reductase [Niastella koreensis]